MSIIGHWAEIYITQSKYTQDESKYTQDENEMPFDHLAIHHCISSFLLIQGKKQRI